ncbi:MAG TPA: discoidin domain-containing protein, partial [Polyangiaceae bacterium]|nr:discoidin domain-containing protein [Polyangiaceae bacterium]
GGSATGGTDSGASGSTSSGGTTDSGGGSAGTSPSMGGDSGTTGSGGSLGIAGSVSGGAGGGSAGGSGGGSAGAAVGGGGAGGAAAGAGGSHSGGTGGALGSGGSGGSTSALCTTPIPLRTSWLGTASSFSNVCTDPTYGLCNPPAYAFDASLSSRFSTGKPQAGTEWLQIDLTTAGTVDQVTVSVSNGDYGRHLQIRMSNTDNDAAAPLLAEMVGTSGLLTFKFAPTTARYILISQTGMLMAGETAWWSVQDVTATCN